MPQLASHINHVADNIETIKAEHNARPSEVSVFPSPDAPVSADLKDEPEGEATEEDIMKIDNRLPQLYTSS